MSSSVTEKLKFWFRDTSPQLREKERKNAASEETLNEALYNLETCLITKVRENSDEHKRRHDARNHKHHG